MFRNNNIHQAQVVQVHITLLGEGAEQNKFHPASISSRNSLKWVSTIISSPSPSHVHEAIYAIYFRGNRDSQTLNLRYPGYFSRF